jgi:PAS domain S-box-containing protein
MEEGVSFEEEFFTKNKSKKILMSGCRISGLDGNLYCDMMWFRDVTQEAKAIDALKAERNIAALSRIRLEEMIDNAPYPMWMRDEKMNLISVNKKYLEIVGLSSKELVIDESVEILNINGDSISKNLAFLASTGNKPKRQSAKITISGKRKSFEVTETPFYADQNMDKIFTVGTMVDASELDEMKRNIKTHQNSHLEILGFLDTAIAVFDSKLKLSFYNSAFAGLWRLEGVWLESKPSYTMFVDLIREKRLLPEVPDFVQYKNEETKDFSTLIEAKEDLLHLPDGRSLRRIRAPHPMGGLTFAFEDISDKLATRRAYNSLLLVRKEILDNILDAVIIFGSEGRCIFYNKAYMKLWKTRESFLKKEPSLEDVIESQKDFFDIGKKWDLLKKGIKDYITAEEKGSFILNRKDNVKIEVSSSLLSDESVMITYKVLG